MANQGHCNIAASGTITWNQWRKAKSYIKPDLSGLDPGPWNFNGFDLNDVDLTGANLEDKDFRNTDLTGTDLRDARLFQCNFEKVDLSKVKNLKWSQLAGTNLAHATLPSDVKFEELKHVEEVSKTARTAFFSILGACLYCWLTIGSTRDIQLVFNSSSKALPFTDTAVSIVYFFLVAPLLLTVFFLHFQLYLLRHWRHLISFPAIFDDGKPLDEKVYPWFLNEKIRKYFHFLKLDGKHPPFFWVQYYITQFLFWCAVPITVLGFWLKYLVRHEYGGTIWHLLLIMMCLFFGYAIWRKSENLLPKGNANENRP